MGPQNRIHTGLESGTVLAALYSQIVIKPDRNPVFVRRVGEIGVLPKGSVQFGDVREIDPRIRHCEQFLEISFAFPPVAQGSPRNLFSHFYLRSSLK
jgi:hypothetical protein